MHVHADSVFFKKNWLLPAQQIKIYFEEIIASQVQVGENMLTLLSQTLKFANWFLSPQSKDKTSYTYVLESLANKIVQNRTCLFLKLFSDVSSFPSSNRKWNIVS
jgi:hypothetical protein